MTCKTLLLSLFAGAALSVHAQVGITANLVGQWEFDDGPGSMTATDSSGNGNDGTLTDFADATFTSMWVTGWSGDAILFNAGGETNDYVSVPDASDLDGFNSSRQLTLAAWVKLSVSGGAQSNNACIISKGAVGLEQFSLGISNGVFQCVIRNSSGKSSQFVNSTITPVAGVWYHVAAIWSSSPQQHYIYINGAYNNTYTGSGFITSAYTTNHPLTIGCREASLTSGYSVPFQGVIDDVRIYNRVLSSNDIYQLYTNYATISNAAAISTQPRNVSAYYGDSPVFDVVYDAATTLVPVTYQWQFDSTNIAGATTSSLVISNAQATNVGSYSVVLSNIEGVVTSSNALLTLQSLPATNTTSGLVGYWTFDDGSGSSAAADSSGNGDTGMLVGFADTTFTTMWTNGIFNGALAFNGDGTGSNVVAIPNIGVAAPPVLDFSTNPIFTLSTWVNGPATQTNGGSIITKGTGGGGEEYSLDITGGAYRFFVRDASGNPYTAQTSIAPNGNWQLVTGVLNASNGVMNCYVNGQLGASAVAPVTLLTNQHEVSIGNHAAASGAYQNAYTGIIDDARIYNRALTSADANALYAAKPAPLSVTWPFSNVVAVAGVNVQLAPGLAGGLPPYTYQWQHNGTNLLGATVYPLVITNVAATNTGSYDLILSDGGIVPSATSAAVDLTITPDLTLNTNGVTWTTQGSDATDIWQGTNIAQLTPLQNNQSNSVFYAFPLNIDAFQASFTYQVTQTPSGSTGPGDGLVFCIQNDPRGASALAYGANGLGVGDIPIAPFSLAITPSVELELNINSANSGSTGISFDTNGELGPVIDSYPIILDNKDPINVLITYEAGLATVTMTDTNIGAEFDLSTNLNIPELLGSDLAYIGFTATTASGYAAQQISNFTFQSLVNLTIQSSGTNAVITWPIGVGGYVLQETSSLSPTNWVNVTNAISVVNGQNHVAVPVTPSPQFFQLLQP